MDATLWHDMIVASPGFLTALAAFIASLRNGKRLRENTQLTQVKADEISDKIDVVHELTNGNTQRELNTAKTLAYEEGKKAAISQMEAHTRRASDKDNRNS